MSPPPNVVATIAPLHSLVAALMAGAGEPYFLLEKAVSAHNYSLRPSDARRLADANLIVQIGPGLESFLQKSIASIADSATVISVARADGTTRLIARQFRHDEDHHDFHKVHDEQHGDQSRIEATETTRSATHPLGDGVDPHLWLDPLNAIVWINVLAQQLERMDPGNSAIYAGNRDTLTAKLQTLHEHLQETLAPVIGQRFIALHDAFQYLEHRYGLQARGVMLDSNEQRVGVASLRRLAKLANKEQINCMITDPGSSKSALKSFAGAAGITTLEIDILGSRLEPGPDLYFALMKELGENLAQCLAAS